jgi:hypothetical protein
LRRAAEQAADIGLGEKTSVDHHLDDEQDREHADLQDDLAGARQASRTLDAVTRAEALAFDFRFIETAAQYEQLIAPHGGLGAKIADRFGRGLLNGCKALFEAERSQAFVIGVEVVDIDAVRILLVRFNSFDNLMFDIIQGLCV